MPPSLASFAHFFHDFPPHGAGGGGRPVTRSFVGWVCGCVCVCVCVCVLCVCVCCVREVLCVRVVLWGTVCACCVVLSFIYVRALALFIYNAQLMPVCRRPVRPQKPALLGNGLAPWRPGRRRGAPQAAETAWARPISCRIRPISTARAEMPG